jgi:propionyl-CoA carboxylase alpha chain
VKIARDIGYPVMIKASAGGGGKGLRVAFNDKEAFEGFDAAATRRATASATTASSSRSSSRSRATSRSRCWATRTATCVYLNERECSIQRRHQKVIEEAPSPFISEATRKAMGEQAVALAKAVKYQSAGTVEFVVGKDQSFYFLEMNTRLQVEHPVTECITGIDLVEQMIRVAAGEKLPLHAGGVKRHGWAIECRINAEDPFRNFLPSTGRLVRYQPAGADHGGRGDPGADGRRRARGHRRLRRRRDPDVLRLDDRQADRARHRPRRRHRQDARSAERLRDPRHQSSNIPFQAALLAHPKFVARRLQHRLHRRALRRRVPRRGRAARRPDFLVALAGAAYRATASAPPASAASCPATSVKDRHGLRRRRSRGGGASTRSDPVHVQGFDPGRRRRRDGGTAHYAIQSLAKLGDIRASGPATAGRSRRRSSAGPVDSASTHNGRQIEAQRAVARAAELLRVMPHKAPPT